MAYSPENNPYIPGDPYSYDLKWLVEKTKEWKDPLDSAERAKASEEAAAGSAQRASDEADRSAGAADRSEGSAEASATSALTAKEYAENIGDPVNGIVTDWLTANVDPVGSAVVVDSSLSISGAAADAKVTGLELKPLKAMRKWAGKNYLDMSTALENTSINSVGEIVTAATPTPWSTEAFLPIDPSETYVISSNGSLKSVLIVAYYDSNKDFISRDINVTSFTTPATTAYFRITTQPSGLFDKPMVEKGSTPTAFVPYWETNNEEITVITDRSLEGRSLSNNLIKKRDIDLKNLTEIAPYDGGTGYIYYDTGLQTIVDNRMSGIQYNKIFKVEENKCYYYSGELLGSAHVIMATFFDANDNIIGMNGIYSTSTAVDYVNEPIVPLPGTVYMICCGYTNDITIKAFVNNAYPNIGKDFIGHADIPKIDKDLNFIVSYGQSLSIGADSLYVADPAVEGCYILGASLGTPAASIKPLELTSNGQDPIVSAVNCLQKLITSNNSNRPTLIAGSYGAGGQSIAQLMSASRQAQIKTDRGIGYNISSSNRYPVFTTAVDDAKLYAISNKKSIGCPAIIFLQGERDYYTDAQLQQAGALNWEAYACGGDKDLYKQYMSDLKDDMQSYIMNVFNQTEKPLFCIYECSGGFIQDHTMSINQAQIEFAQENDDVILLPAPYFTPNYNNGHLSTNGYRWYGECIARALYETLCNRSEYSPMMPCGAIVEDHLIKLKIKGLVAPAIVNTLTVEAATNYGFAVWKDGVRIYPTEIHPYGDEIYIYFAEDLSTASALDLSYAGQEVSGTGNICDSAAYKAAYTFQDASADHGSSGTLNIVYNPAITGEPYPMQNWLMPFYVQLI